MSPAKLLQILAKRGLRLASPRMVRRCVRRTSDRKKFVDVESVWTTFEGCEGHDRQDDSSPSFQSTTKSIAIEPLLRLNARSCSPISSVSKATAPNEGGQVASSRKIVLSIFLIRESSGLASRSAE